MSNLQTQQTNATTFNDNSQLKTSEFTKKTNLATESGDTGKPEFDYNRPAPTTLQTSGTTTGGSAIADTTPITTTKTRTTTTTSSPNINYTSGQPSTTENLKSKMASIGHSIEEAVTSASQSINQAISGQKSQEGTTHHPYVAGTAQQYNTAAPGTEYNPNTNTNVNQPQHQQGGFGSKLSDMMAHVGAALQHGHPVHAVTNASTAAKVGECERVKHVKGPLVDESFGTTNANTLNNPNFNSAGQAYDNTAATGRFNEATSNTFNQSTAYENQPTMGHTSDHSDYTTSDKLHDMASHISAQFSHGNPIHAITDAPAAARIAEAEKLKHEKGPISDSAPIHAATTAGQSIPSGTGHGSFGGVTGMSGQGGAASTMSTQELYQKRGF